MLGVGFDRLGLEAAAGEIGRRLERGERTFVITANPELVMHARRDATLAEIVRRADLVLADGTGVVVAARLLGDPLPARAPGRMLVPLVLREASRLGRSVFLLGGAPGIAERAAAALSAAFPGLRLAGVFAGDGDPRGDVDTLARLRRAAPEVLLVAYGMPKQERWLARNLPGLSTVVLGIGVGGVLDQLAGVGTVPPAVVHRWGLEWLWRLVHEPRRWRRQLVIPTFALLVLRARFARVRPAGP